MEHPVIVNAFANAQQSDQTSNSDSKEPSIYMSFHRPNIFYKDTYWILTGTRKEVAGKIQNAYADLNAERQEPYFERGDQNNLVDTPFDTWCSGICNHIQCDDHTVVKCDDHTVVKCGSHWIATEHQSKEELDAYVCNIQLGYFPRYSIEYM